MRNRNKYRLVFIRASGSSSSFQKPVPNERFCWPVVNARGTLLLHGYRREASRPLIMQTFGFSQFINNTLFNVSSDPSVRESFRGVLRND